MKSKIFRLPILIIKASYYGVRLFLRPHELHTLISLANQLTELPAFDAAVEHLKTDKAAKELIEQRYSPGMPTIEELKNYPANSFGHDYYKHMASHRLTVYPTKFTLDMPEKIYVRERQRQIHDLVHALLKIGVTVEEEAKLNAVFMPKGCSPFTSVIVGGAFLHFLFKRPKELIKLTRYVNDGFNFGEQMASPFSVKWEEHFYTPTAQLRRLLGVSKT
ncbi:MAG: Coq4 family protein [Bdellovibrionota bacterium]